MTEIIHRVASAAILAPTPHVGSPGNSARRDSEGVSDLTGCPSRGRDQVVVARLARGMDVPGQRKDSTGLRHPGVATIARRAGHDTGGTTLLWKAEVLSCGLQGRFTRRRIARTRTAPTGKRDTTRRMLNVGTAGQPSIWFGS